MGACCGGESTTTKLEMMKASPFYTHLSEPTCRQFAALCTVERYPNANFRIYSEDQSCSDLYLIVDGAVQVTALDADDYDQFLCVKRAGQFFGEQAVLSDVVFPKRNTSVTTQSATTVLVISRDNFRRFKEETGINETLRLIMGDGVTENLKRIPFLSDLTKWKLQMLGNLFHYKTVDAGRDLFKEGDLGTELFVISKGKVEATTTNREGKTFKFREMGPGEYFGEISLMINMPRTATITALEKTLLLVLNKQDFTNFMNIAPDVQEIFAKVAKHRVTSLFKTFNVPFFQSIPSDRFHQLSRACEIEQYEANSVIFEEGEAGDAFYLIPFGSCDIYIKNKAGEPVKVKTLERGQFFGEIALVTDLPRTATVKTATYCVLLNITKEKFRKFVLDTPQAYADFSIKLSRREVPLSAVLLHRIGIRLFTEFLEMEFSGENLAFWHEVRTYSSITDDAARHAEAKRMYNTYITQGGSKQVNLPSTVREELERNMKNPAAITQRMFRRAQLEIEIMLSHDSFKRFKESPLFANLLAQVGSYSDQAVVDSQQETTQRQNQLQPTGAITGGGTPASKTRTLTATGIATPPGAVAAAALAAGGGAGVAVDSKDSKHMTPSSGRRNLSVLTGANSPASPQSVSVSIASGGSEPRTPGDGVGRARGSSTEGHVQRVLSIERPAALSIERKSITGEPNSGRLREPGSGRLKNPMLAGRGQHERRRSGVIDQIMLDKD